MNRATVADFIKIYENEIQIPIWDCCGGTMNRRGNPPLWRLCHGDKNDKLAFFVKNYEIRRHRRIFKPANLAVCIIFYEMPRRRGISQFEMFHKLV